MEKKERFRCNLAEGMAKYGLTEQQLADELGMDRYWRKWLRRLLKDGLERPNAKSHDMLERLADRLGFGSAGHIWLGYADPNTTAVEEFKKLWAAADRPLKRKIERQISEWLREIERQVTQWRRIRVAELIARLKFSWDDLSSEERFASTILTPRDYIGITGEELDVLDLHGLMSKVVLDIIVEKDLSPELPPNDIWKAVRPELVRIVEGWSSCQKSPKQEQLKARVPK